MPSKQIVIQKRDGYTLVLGETAATIGATRVSRRRIATFLRKVSRVLATGKVDRVPRHVGRLKIIWFNSDWTKDVYKYDNRGSVKVGCQILTRAEVRKIRNWAYAGDKNVKRKSTRSNSRSRVQGRRKR